MRCRALFGYLPFLSAGMSFFSVPQFIHSKGIYTTNTYLRQLLKHYRFVQWPLSPSWADTAYDICGVWSVLLKQDSGGRTRRTSCVAYRHGVPYLPGQYQTLYALLCYYYFFFLGGTCYSSAPSSCNVDFSTYGAACLWLSLLLVCLNTVAACPLLGRAAG